MHACGSEANVVVKMSASISLMTLVIQIKSNQIKYLLLMTDKRNLPMSTLSELFRRTKLLEKVQKRFTRMIPGLRKFSYETRTVEAIKFVDIGRQTNTSRPYSSK